MAKTKSRAFSMIELVLVVALIGILSLVGITSYGKSRNKAFSKEAIANLKLITSAERIYRMENDTYGACNCSSTANCNNSTGCNTRLKLNLNPTNWTYRVQLTGGGNATISVQGTSASIPGCLYTLTNFTTEVYAKTGCP